VDGSELDFEAYCYQSLLLWRFLIPSRVVDVPDLDLSAYRSIEHERNAQENDNDRFQVGISIANLPEI